MSPTPTADLVPRLRQTTDFSSTSSLRTSLIRNAVPPTVRESVARWLLTYGNDPGLRYSVNQGHSFITYHFDNMSISRSNSSLSLNSRVIVPRPLRRFTFTAVRNRWDNSSPHFAASASRRGFLR